VLADASLADSFLTSIVVEKPLALELDLGSMMAIDTNQLIKEQVTTPAYLLSLARDNTQLLIKSNS